METPLIFFKLKYEMRNMMFCLIFFLNMFQSCVNSKIIIMIRCAQTFDW